MDQNIPFISSPLLVLVLVLLSSLVFLNVLTPSKPLSLLRLASLSPPPPSSPSELNKCDYSYGRWVSDENRNVGSYTEECPFLDSGFQCVRCGRKDTVYQNWRWQPHSCDLPRYVLVRVIYSSRFHEKLSDACCFIIFSLMKHCNYIVYSLFLIAMQ